MRTHLLQAAFGSRWAIRREALPSLFSAIRMDVSAPEASAMQAMAPARTAGQGAVAVLPITGVITHRSSWISRVMGWTTVQDLRAAFRQAMNDESVAAIVFDVDSPGGTVDGVPELADEIFAARGQKPIRAVSNTLCCSAAYWLASQADQVLGSSSAQTGSIGVYTIHEEISKWLETAGINITMIFAGAHKVDGNCFEPLSDGAKAELQDGVDEVYGDFLKAVARGRGTTTDAVKKSYGDGRVFSSPAGKQVGLIDGVATLEVVLAGASSAGKGRAARGASAAAGATRLAGTIPPDVSEHLAPKDTPWSRPTLKDFTDKAWGDLTDDEKKKIAGHYAWSKTWPPEAFGDLVLPHHRATDGDVVFKGVAAAAGRLDQSEIPAADRAHVKSHLRHHYDQFGEAYPDSIKGMGGADRRADKSSPMCDCDDECPCQEGDGSCPTDCPTCEPDCACQTSAKAQARDRDRAALAATEGEILRQS